MTNPTVFNKNNRAWKNGEYPLFLGEQLGLHDTINVRYPKILSLAKRQVSQRWVFDEFNHDQSKIDFIQCPESISECMLINIAFQWDSDSIAARSIASMFSPFVTNSELFKALLENANMEVTHAETYSEIIRTCIPDTQRVFKIATQDKEILMRAETISKVFDRLIEVNRKQHELSQDEIYDAIMLGMCALYMLERIQFMASFSATFAIVEQGYFQSIGMAIQKIMQDELFCHAELDREVINIEYQTKRGKQSYKRTKHIIQKMFNEVMEAEFRFPSHIFSQGRSIVGINESLMCAWSAYNAAEVEAVLGLKAEFAIPKANPLPWMDSYIDMDKRQNAQQEADGNNYALFTMRDDLGDSKVDVGFAFNL